MTKPRIASIDDRNAIIDFLKTHWNENLIYVRDTDFFDYDFSENDKINFVIANDEEGNIIGTHGFLKYSFSDKPADAFAVLWRAPENKNFPMLGIKLFRHMLRKCNLNSVSSVGINDATVNTYKYLGMYTSKLEHYFILNPHFSDFKIASVPHSLKPSLSYDSNNKLKRITGEQALEVFDPSLQDPQLFTKDKTYISKRFVHSKYYQYIFLQIKDTRNFFIAREDSVEGSKCLRVLDYFGQISDMKLVSNSFVNLSIENKYEYVDFYCEGIHSDILKSMNFTLKPHDSELIIPNYFSPFVQKNININLFTTEKNKKCFFKGDGDQDRPN